jgi:hypothetical protein
MVLHYDKPLQLGLSCRGLPGFVAKLLLDAGIGAVVKALQTIGERPRTAAKHGETPDISPEPRSSAGPREPKQKIFYISARKRNC